MNWKTTLSGILGGLLIGFGPNVGARLSGDKTKPPITIVNVLEAAGVAALGYFAKDKDVPPSK